MPELMSIAEIAEELRIMRQRVHQLRATKGFPAQRKKPTSVSKRVSPAERLRVEIDGVFGGGDLSHAVEEVARLGAQLLLQCALEAEVAGFLGRDRYQRAAFRRR